MIEIMTPFTLTPIWSHKCCVDIEGKKKNDSELRFRFEIAENKITKKKKLHDQN